MKLPLTALAALAAATLRAIDPALLGVGFVPAAEAQPALDTTRRTKVEDAWAYPITAKASLIPPEATDVTKQAFLRNADDAWQVVAIKATFKLKGKAQQEALAKTLEAALPRTLTETIGTKTRSTFQSGDEHAMLTTAPGEDDAATITLLVWRDTLADNLIAQETADDEEAPKEAAEEPDSGERRLRSFLGIPFGRVNARTAKLLRKTSVKGLYNFYPKKHFLRFDRYYADTTDNGEVYTISASMSTGKWDGRDEALGEVRLVAYYIEKKYNCRDAREDLTDSFTNPRIRYDLGGTTISIYATVSEHYDWTIWLDAKDDVISKKDFESWRDNQLDAL